MCGVLYFRGDGNRYKGLVIRVLEQSRIRGLHAFGVSLRSSSKEEFQTVRTFDLPAAIEFIRENTFSELIGHCRYDTSGDWKIINNNQPIVLGQSLLAFNGVVRMSTREEYQQEFQREYTTENDGEIILRMLVEEDRRLMSLLEQKRVTFAGVAHVNNKAMALRNERRPLWRALSMDVEFVFSTYDIWSRAIQSTEFYYLSALDIPPMEPVWL